MFIKNSRVVPQQFSLSPGERQLLEREKERFSLARLSPEARQKLESIVALLEKKGSEHKGVEVMMYVPEFFEENLGIEEIEERIKSKIKKSYR